MPSTEVDDSGDQWQIANQLLEYTAMRLTARRLYWVRICIYFLFEK